MLNAVRAYDRSDFVRRTGLLGHRSFNHASIACAAQPCDFVLVLSL
jgi:hypothetical protein